MHILTYIFYFISLSVSLTTSSINFFFQLFTHPYVIKNICPPIYILYHLHKPINTSRSLLLFFLFSYIPSFRMELVFFPFFLHCMFREDIKQALFSTFHIGLIHTNNYVLFSLLPFLPPTNNTRPNEELSTIFFSSCERPFIYSKTLTPPP